MNTTTADVEKWRLYTWNEQWAKSHEERGQVDVWDIKQGDETIVDHLSKKECLKLIAAHERALAQARAPLVEAMTYAAGELQRVAPMSHAITVLDAALTGTGEKSDA